jgi:hypothetical protein
MPSTDVLSAVRISLETIADSLDEAFFVIPGPRRDAGEPARVAVIETVRKYLLHRLREPDAPVVAVLVGLSGVGKSTILNSLAQDAVSATGVVRPTTAGSVLWAHRDHAARYWTEFIGRVRDQIGPTTDVVIGEDQLTGYLTFVDTPPLELTPEGAATSAAETLMFADICVFVTSAARYADAAPLEFLQAARSRGIPILFVLNRLPRDMEWRRELLADFAEKLVAAGLLPEPDPGFIFGVEDAENLRWHGGLGPEAVASIRKELSEVSDPEFRLVVIDETAEATVRAVAAQTETLAGMLSEEVAERSRLGARSVEIYEEEAARLQMQFAAGEFADLAGHEIWAQAALGLSGLITRSAGVAAEKTAKEWLDDPAARGLLDPGNEGLRRHGPQAAESAKTELDDWMSDLEDLVARTRRRRPRRRKMRRLVHDLWKIVLDPDFESRRWRDDHHEAVVEARSSLGAAMDRAVTADGARFLRRLGPAVDSFLPERVLAAAAYLTEMPADVDRDDQPREVLRDG